MNINTENYVVSKLEPQLMNYTTSEVYLERMVSEVKPEWIQDSSNRAVFEMIKEYWLASGRIPNLDIASEELRKKLGKEEAQAPILVFSKLQNFKTDLHDNQYSIAKQSVESNWIEQNLSFCMRQATTEMQSNNGQQALLTMEQAVESIRYSTSDTKIVDYDIAEFASNALDRYEQDFKEEELISSGVDEIDSRLGGGFRKPNVIALGCGTQVGKSIISMNLGYSAYQQGLNVAYVTIEMSEEEFLARLHSRITGVPATNILMRDMNDIQKLQLRQKVLLDTVNPKFQDRAEKYLNEIGSDLLKFSKEDMDRNFFESDFYVKRPNTYYPIDIPSGCRLEIVRSKIIKLKEKRGCDVLIIDYAGIMDEILKGEQSWQSYSNLWLRLKALARELDVLLISPVQAHDEGQLKYSTAVRDHIDVGLNWKRTDEDMYFKRVRFWFTKLRHGKQEFNEQEQDMMLNFNERENQSEDLTMRNPIYASLDTDVMLLSDYENPLESEFISI